VVEQGRASLAALLAMPADGAAFVEGASAGLATLLRVWPLTRGSRVAVAPSEWGPNREAFAAAGHELVELPVDSSGAVDIDALEAWVRADPPALVHLVQAASHRGLVQPVREVVRAAGGVPVWVDAAQALGHLDTATGADAVYATSRKWLAGPRGVGIVAVAERHWHSLRVTRPGLAPAGLAPMRYLDSHDAHIAGRVGLANAVTEFVADGPEAVWARLLEVGRLTRAVLGEVPGWTVDDGAGAITALTPTAGQDVAAVRAGLLAAGILTTVSTAARAPGELAGPTLRVSPHVDADEAALERLARALPPS
jgi:pyridoxal 5-phosphate dependent beta-lyase